MIEDKAQLQFILDTVQKLGGAPSNLDQLQEEAVHSESTGDVWIFSWIQCGWCADRLYNIIPYSKWLISFFVYIHVLLYNTCVYSILHADPSSKPGAGTEGVCKGGVEMKRERMKVLALDHALRRETHRASQLAEELQRLSIKRDSPLPLLSPGCVYKVHMSTYMYVIMYNTCYICSVYRI